MVQPYLAGVEGHGETALVYLGGEFSHAIHKGPMLGGDRVVATASSLEEQISAREPTAAERARRRSRQSRMSTERFGRLAYARVDLLPALGGHLVLELELVEPSLFLTTSPGAPERFARVLGRARDAETRGAGLRTAKDLLHCHLDFARVSP